MNTVQVESDFWLILYIIPSSLQDKPAVCKPSPSVAYPGILFGGGDSKNSVEDRENGDLGAVAPLVRGSGGSCNLVQEISFYIVKFS